MIMHSYCLCLSSSITGSFSVIETHIRNSNKIYIGRTQWFKDLKEMNEIGSDGNSEKDGPSDVSTDNRNFRAGVAVARMYRTFLLLKFGRGGCIRQENTATCED